MSNENEDSEAPQEDDVEDVVEVKRRRVV